MAAIPRNINLSIFNGTPKYTEYPCEPPKEPLKQLETDYEVIYGDQVLDNESHKWKLTLIEGYNDKQKSIYISEDGGKTFKLAGPSSYSFTAIHDCISDENRNDYLSVTCAPIAKGLLGTQEFTLDQIKALHIAHYAKTILDTPATKPSRSCIKYGIALSGIALSIIASLAIKYIYNEASAK